MMYGRLEQEAVFAKSLTLLTTAICPGNMHSVDSRAVAGNLQISLSGAWRQDLSAGSPGPNTIMLFTLPIAKQKSVE
jgi:hypothetical protein